MHRWMAMSSGQSDARVRVVLGAPGPEECAVGLLPWEAFRTIASLELLGALVGVMVLMPTPEQVPASTGLATLTCGTDNQGNTFLLDKLMTTKYPLAVVLMELACQLGRRRAALHARWIPRLQNEEADALTNEEFHHFDAKLRIPVNLGDLGFVVMDELFNSGEEFVKELDSLKAQERAEKDRVGLVKRVKRSKADQPLREREPWG